jgi:hypothetical protein
MSRKFLSQARLSPRRSLTGVFFGEHIELPINVRSFYVKKILKIYYTILSPAYGNYFTTFNDSPFFYFYCQLI